MKSITKEIEELRQLTTPDLVERYRELWGKNPHCKHREWLWKRCAWKLQEQRHGGLSQVAKARLEELIADIDLPLGERNRTVTGTLRAGTRGGEHKVGTVFTRTWKGRDVRAVAVDGGFECEGVVHRSLSAVARAVTGSHWNGRLFFGLTERKKR